MKKSCVIEIRLKYGLDFSEAVLIIFSFFLWLFLFEEALEGFWEFEGIGGYHEFGFGIEIFLFIFCFVVGGSFVSFHVYLYLLMKREYCYLPDLNSLFAQKVRY